MSPNPTKKTTAASTVKAEKTQVGGHPETIESQIIRNDGKKKEFISRSLSRTRRHRTARKRYAEEKKP